MCDDVNTDCQTLLANEPSCHGWMKIQRKIHEFSNTLHLNNVTIDSLTKKIAKSVKWDRRYFILSGSIIFIFKNETGKMADRILRLIDFSEVSKIKMDNNEVPWPIEMKKKSSNKSYIFAPISQKEQQKWIEGLQSEFDKLPHEEFGQTSRPLPTPPKFQTTKKEKGNYLKSITDQDDDDDSDEYEVASEFTEPKNLNDGLKFGISKHIYKKEIPDRQNGESTIPNQLPPVICPKPKLNTLGKQQTLPIKPESRKPPIIKINPIVRPDYPTINDDGVYEIEFPRNQNANIGFWKGTTEQATDAIKKLIVHEGAFLIRNSKETDGFTLSVINEGVIRKFPIHKDGNLLYLGGHTFTDLGELVSYHMINNLPQKNFSLTNPYSFYSK